MILPLLLLPSLALTALGQAFTPAPVITNNPPVTYTATLSNNPNTSIRGYVTASGAPDGVGVVFRVNFTGLPPNIGPFPYHIHLYPVPASGDCYATGDHLDPYSRGEQPPCDPSDPATCQIGDLSGKHGFASGNDFFAVYNDPYLSTNPNSNAFLGDRSIVIHAASLARLNCGNFQLVPSPQAAGVSRLNVGVNVASTSTRTSSTRTPTSTPTSHPTSTRTPSPQTTGVSRPNVGINVASTSTRTPTRISTTLPTSTRTSITQPVLARTTTFTSRPRTSTR